jgi:hypothetical protein
LYVGVVERGEHGYREDHELVWVSRDARSTARANMAAPPAACTV